ncbi:iron-sulfur cluster assembly scaffold protein [uncultured Bartonella sp.]|uniref:iron-sulfur cluster assembly scaffold protein n=1 Tax=uncultured Bartonella sp. TaxID=104108 RepID=UPI00261C98E0|nr:iron-sulfur cluster assembly scaffold protein [uncultured Bartonella sp.]
MIDDIYNDIILGYAAHIAKLGRLAHPDATARKHSRICGSTVTVDLNMKDGIVTDFAHIVRACALGQASSSLMASHIIGASAEELRMLRQTIWLMLTENGPAPNGKFQEFACLEPIKDYKARQPSTMLTFDAVIDCIEQIEAQKNG